MSTKAPVNFSGWKKLAIGFLVLSLPIPLWAEARDWRFHARRLTGFTEEIRQESLKWLTRQKTLPPILKDALPGEDRYLALDTIVALKLRGFVPDLLEAAKTDEDGTITLAINSLLAPDNARQIIEAYRNRLSQSNVSIPSLVAMIDVLGRLGHQLEDSKVEGFLKHPDFEVRSAALYYIRLLTRHRSRPLYIDAVPIAFSDPAYQLRLQAAMMLEEMKLRLPDEWRRAVKQCSEDTHIQVKRVCEKVQP